MPKNSHKNKRASAPLTREELHSILSAQRPDLLEQRIEQGLDPNQPLSGGDQPLLHTVIHFINLVSQHPVEDLGPYLDVLLPHVNVNLQDKRGDTILFPILQDIPILHEGEEGLSFLKRFLEHGLDVNLQDKEGYTLLHYVMESNPIADLLTEQGVALIRLFLDHGADVNLQDDRGRTPLLKLFYEYAEQHHTIQEDWPERMGGMKARLEDIVNLFIEHGLHPMPPRQNNNGSNRSNGHPKTIPQLAEELGLDRIARRLADYEQQFKEQHPNWNVSNANQRNKAERNRLQRYENERKQQGGKTRKGRKGRKTRKGRKAGRKTRKGRK